MDPGDKLIERLLASPGSGEFDNLANELLTEYLRGSGVESLRNLLQSSSEKVVGEALWIASELGEKGKALLPDMAALLSHPSKKVRFWAIDCVLLWAGPTDFSELAFAAALVADPDEAVRWKAMGFLAAASREQLHAASDGLTSANSGQSFVNEITWLVSPEANDRARIVSKLQAHNALHRKIAAVAAVRLNRADSNPLYCAASSSDAEIVQFAQDMLKRIGLS